MYYIDRMPNLSIFNDLIKIYNLIDTLESLDEKFKALENWLGRQPDIIRARICNFAEPFDSIPPAILKKRDLDELALKTTPHILRDLVPAEAGLIICQDSRVNVFLGETGWTGLLICAPIISQKGQKIGAILLQAGSPEETFGSWEGPLKFLGDKLKQIFEVEFLKDKLEKEDDFLDLFISQTKGNLPRVIKSQSSRLINWLNLPLYIANINGKILYASSVFLNLLQFSNLEELATAGEIFPEPAARQAEIREVLLRGRVDNHQLTIRRKDGHTLEVRDSALLVGSHIFGFFFDVTELVRLNRELKEALQMQEFLNDKLISSSLLLQKTQTTTIRSLARLAEYRDGETGEHLERICGYSAVLTQEVYKKQPYNWRVTEKYIYDLIVSSMLHDIGKVGVPDSILLKPGKLNHQEFERMKNHTVWGWAILNQADSELGEQSYLTLASSIALHHHERYDGTGYPHQLKGEKIPLSARIEAIADVYDALTSRRPYKEAWSHQQAVEEITNQKGRHFDPVLVDIFLDIEDKFYKIRNKMDN